MSNNPSLMDTEKGGEQNQYESVHTFVEPHAKQAGQLGDPATGTSTTQDTRASNAPNTHGITPAEKIRYGQALQEGGMGGKTTSSEGEARTEGGFGGTERLEEGEGQMRREQGYTAGREMARDVGA